MGYIKNREFNSFTVTSTAMLEQTSKSKKKYAITSNVWYNTLG
jgi:hypothetical protein